MAGGIEFRRRQILLSVAGLCLFSAARVNKLDAAEIQVYDPTVLNEYLYVLNQEREATLRALFINSPPALFYQPEERVPLILEFDRDAILARARLALDKVKKKKS